ncbi:cell wall hydrolase [Alicyclobacillus fastidiosus]|uniref:Cell wall hydrolase n=1 Tax=Alicyclobacillus fastidiosus TaxID=392011 RepID=A0ABV5ALX1_9BACL|nr:cell wall hydrolase [Alicyclobacillus fastidiosus]WEH10170.1 cell wall hydrolase [Alicyclobacillus fastidiosus]
MRHNRIPTIITAAVTTLGIPAVVLAAATYTVRPGDSLWSIAHSHGITLAQLESANPQLSDYNQIHPGEDIVLPNGQTSTADDLYWLAHIISAEAQGESVQAQEAVGDVVLNRLHAGGYGDTVHDVIFQVVNGAYQFTPVENGAIYNTPTQNAIAAAENDLQGLNLVPSALVFYNPYEVPAGSWVTQQPTLMQIDSLVFAK